MIHANCSACGTQFTVSDEMAGRCCPCTACGGQVVFPSPMQRPGINVQCGRCGNVYLVPTEFAGSPTQCGRCGNLVPYPGAPNMPGYGSPAGAFNMPQAGPKPQPVPSPYAMNSQYGQPGLAGPLESSNRGKVLAVASR